VAEHHDRRVRREAGHVAPDEVKLVCPEVPSFSRLSVLTSAMKCTPLRSKLYQPSPWVPAPNTLRYFSPASSTESCSPGVVITLPVRRPDIICFTWSKLRGRGQVGEISRVHHELRPVGQRVDLVDRLGEGPLHGGVGRTGETQVAVADLHEPQRVRVVERRRWAVAAEVADHFTTPGPVRLPVHDPPVHDGVGGGHPVSEFYDANIGRATIGTERGDRDPKGMTSAAAPAHRVGSARP